MEDLLARGADFDFGLPKAELAEETFESFCGIKY